MIVGKVPIIMSRIRTMDIHRTERIIIRIPPFDNTTKWQFWSVSKRPLTVGQSSMNACYTGIVMTSV